MAKLHAPVGSRPRSAYTPPVPVSTVAVVADGAVALACRLRPDAANAVAFAKVVDESSRPFTVTVMSDSVSV